VIRYSDLDMALTLFENVALCLFFFFPFCSKYTTLYFFCSYSFDCISTKDQLFPDIFVPCGMFISFIIYLCYKFLRVGCGGGEGEEF